jgi:hypothetical protein
MFIFVTSELFIHVIPSGIPGIPIKTDRIKRHALDYAIRIFIAAQYITIRILRANNNGRYIGVFTVRLIACFPFVSYLV